MRRESEYVHYTLYHLKAENGLAPGEDRTGHI